MAHEDVTVEETADDDSSTTSSDETSVLASERGDDDGEMVKEEIEVEIITIILRVTANL